MADQRRGGIIQLQVAGVLHDAKGEFSYNIGRAKRDPVVGSDRVHGFTETPQVGFIEGEVTDRGGLDLNALVTLEGVTVNLQLANGKVIVLRNAWYAGEGTGNTGEGNIGVRFEGEGEEVA